MPTGWEDDEDLGLDDDNLLAGESTGAAVVADKNDGWGDDDHALDDIESEDPVAEDEGAVQDGWGDDLDFSDEGDDAHIASEGGEAGVDAANDSAEQPTKNSFLDEWDNDLADALEASAGGDALNARQPAAPSEPVKIASAQPLLEELSLYLQMLPNLVTSVNALLDAEYNNPHKAQELMAYYDERPGLVQYTVEKELPRMEYLVVANNDIVSEKSHIADILTQHADTILARCANQSLLADLLHVCSDPDSLIRPQYMATAIATYCHIEVNFEALLVKCRSNLDLSLPTENGQLQIADISVHLTFSPHPEAPYIHYQLDRVQSLPMDPSALVSVANLLQQLHVPENEVAPVAEDGVSHRDRFLQQSQTLVNGSTKGLRSALSEIESVAQFGSKLKQLPGFLPSNVLNEAERDYTEQQKFLPQQRPSSILGGFVRSLAQKVALPDETPDLYDQWQQSQPDRQNAAPPRPPPGPFFQQLYNHSPPEVVAVPQPPREGGQSSTETHDRPYPQLYNRSTPETTIQSILQSNTPKITNFPRLYNPQTPTTPQRQQLKTEKSPLQLRGAAGTAGSCSTTQDPLLFASSKPFTPNRHTPSDAPTAGELPANRSVEAESCRTDDIWDDDDVGIVAVDSTIAPKSGRYRSRWVNPMPGSRNLVDMAKAATIR